MIARWKRRSVATLIPRILESGYGFDFIDDGTIDRISAYPIVVLPAVQRIPAETYRKLEAYVKKGGILIATKRTPSLSPGMIDAEKETSEVRGLSQRLFAGAKPPAHLISDEDEKFGTALRTLHTPDVALSPSVPAIGFIHRNADANQIYFIANTGNKPARTQATFRTRGLKPEWWDPFSGEKTPARVLQNGSIALDLEPYGSRVLVFSKDASTYKAPARLTAVAPIELTGTWKLSFDDIKRSVTLDKLQSWTENPETRYYSGQATYEKTATVPGAALKSGTSLFLDFGEAVETEDQAEGKPGMRAALVGPVREAAVVYINGQRAGSVWKPPYQVEVTKLLKAGSNTFRIVVANTAINALAKGPLPDYKALEKKYGSRFQPQDMNDLKPLPAGLLGPVRIVSNTQ